MNDLATATMGDNNPPVSLIEDLADRYKSMLDQFAELSDVARTVPDRIDNDITHAKVIELIKKMRVLEKTADATRDIEREPYKQKVDETNGFFKSRIEPMSKLRATLNERHEAYSQHKAAAEKRRLEEEAEKRRVAEQAALAAAAEAERKKREAEAAQAKAEAEARAAEAARLKAVQDRAAAEARALQARADEVRLAAERKERERLAEIDAAAQAERRRVDDEQAAEARKRRLDEEAKALAAKLAAQAALAEQRDAEEASRVARAEVKTAGRDEREHMAQALREDKRATRIEAVADGPDADLARSRSEHGAVGTLTRRWTCRITDRNKLDKAALWPHVNGDALDAALWKWMMSQAQDKRVMAGAVMEEETFGQVR